MSYRTISSNEDVDQLLRSAEPVWLLKHSNACGISFAALEQFERYLGEHGDEAAAMLVIQEHRPVSSYIAEKTGRVHQSPQLFLLENGEVRWMATHYSITAEAMAQARAEIDKSQ